MWRVAQKVDWTLWKGTYRPSGRVWGAACHRHLGGHGGQELCRRSLGVLQAEVAYCGSTHPRAGWQRAV
jgi:hypothetical protein